MRTTLMAVAALLVFAGVSNAQERGGFDPAQIIERIFEKRRG